MLTLRVLRKAAFSAVTRLLPCPASARERRALCVMPFPSLTRPAERPEIRYFFDPLCGWCFGFSPVILRLYEELQDRYDFVAHPGGMVTGERAGPMAPEKAAYIKNAFPRVEQTTGVRFGAAYRAALEGGRVQDSEPPSQAVTALARLDGDPGRTVPFAHALLQAIFVDGADPNDPATLAALAQPFGYDDSTFLKSLSDPDTAGFTQAGFTAASQIGITGFPTLVLRQGQRGTILAQGFAPYETIIERLSGTDVRSGN